MSWVGELTLIDHLDNNFEGRGVLFNTSLGQATVMSVTGKVFTAGIGGKYTTESGWSGTLSGTTSGGRLSLLFGGLLSGGPCKESGSMSATLANPATGGLAPFRLEGYSLRMDVASGSGVLATNGSYQADFSDNDYSFNFFPVPAFTPVQDGIFHYTKTAANAATMTWREVYESGDHMDSTLTLTFTSASGGTFSKRAIGVTGTQAGTFTLFR